MIERRISKVSGVMAVDAILINGTSWYVVCQFADADPVVMTCITATDHAGMVVGACGESPRSMAIGAILIIRCGWHVRVEKRGRRFAAGSTRSVGNMTTVGTATGDASMIDVKCWSETFGVMT